MKLVEGEGNAYDSRGKALEGDVFNTVFIVVSIILFCSARDSHRSLSKVMSCEGRISPRSTTHMLQSTC